MVECPGSSGCFYTHVYEAALTGLSGLLRKGGRGGKDGGRERRREREEYMKLGG